MLEPMYIAMAFQGPTDSGFVCPKIEKHKLLNDKARVN